MNDSITQIGIAIVITGLLAELVGFAGLAFYPIRRRLPMRLPLHLHTAGFTAFYLGVVILLVRKLFT